MKPTLICFLSVCNCSKNEYTPHTHSHEHPLGKKGCVTLLMKQRIQSKSVTTTYLKPRHTPRTSSEWAAHTHTLINQRWLISLDVHVPLFLNVLRLKVCRSRSKGRKNLLVISLEHHPQIQQPAIPRPNPPFICTIHFAFSLPKTNDRRKKGNLVSQTTGWESQGDRAQQQSTTGWGLLIKDGGPNIHTGLSPATNSTTMAAVGVNT